MGAPRGGLGGRLSRGCGSLPGRGPGRTGMGARWVGGRGTGLGPVHGVALRGLPVGGPAGDHALEPSGLLRLFRGFGVRSRHPRRAPCGGPQRQRDGVEDLPRGHRTGAGDAGLAAQLRRAAARFCRHHQRHGLNLHLPRAGRGPREGASRGARARIGGSSSRQGLRDARDPFVHPQVRPCPGAGPRWPARGRDRAGAGHGPGGVRASDQT